MCGIFGYIGKKPAVPIAIQGLKKLEYRGYDSSGIAAIQDGKIVYCKEVGKIAVMESKVNDVKIESSIAISQTRWATHGKPSRVNAHPHFDNQHTLAVVHNGIIENHTALRKALEEKGSIFVSDTDTEVIAHLISDLYQGDLLKAVQESSALLKGSYAIAVIHKDHPDEIIATTYEMPLAVGRGKEENFISSDINAFDGSVQNVLYLADGETVKLMADSVKVFDSSMLPISKEMSEFSIKAQEITKGKYEHYTLKEIYEQPESIRASLLNRTLDEYGTSILEGLNFEVNDLLSIERILILACGTSLHAGYIASYLFEDYARIPTRVEISSEFRYRNPVVPTKTLVIAISQSGETADTLAAVREIKAKGARVLAICNVLNSSLVREAHDTLYLRAGPEIGVCSTKAFTSQVSVLTLFILLMARIRHMEKAVGQEILRSLKKLPEDAVKVLEKGDEIQALAKKYTQFENFFFLGRNLMYPTALEGALKLKEISYINANAYPAGEMKHGPLALINPECPTVALLGNQLTFDKILSNLSEVKSRNGPILAIAQEGTSGFEKLVDDIFWVPKTLDITAPIPTSIALQLFAYHIARFRGADIDQPRNLAKSVTVE